MNKKEFIIWMVERDFELDYIMTIIHEVEIEESIVKLIKGHPVRFACYPEPTGYTYFPIIFPSIKDIKKNKDFIYDVVAPSNPDSQLGYDFFEDWERHLLIAWFGSEDDESWPLALKFFDDAQMVNELGDVKDFD